MFVNTFHVNMHQYSSGADSLHYTCNFYLILCVIDHALHPYSHANSCFTNRKKTDFIVVYRTETTLNLFIFLDQM